MELIAQTAPEANIPSKNHAIFGLVPKRYINGENATNPKKNPTQVDVHIIQLKSSDKNLNINPI
jgi:hypothetical protein